MEEWQTSWNNSIGNKLLDIKPTIGEYQSVVRNIRREEVVLARLRLGHTRVTHSYLLQGEEHPQCPRSDSTTLPWSLGHTSHLGTILIVILVPVRECQE